MAQFIWQENVLCHSEDKHRMQIIRTRSKWA